MNVILQLAVFLTIIQPTLTQPILWQYCHVAESDWTVVTTGSLVTTPNLNTQGYYTVLSITGTRVQTNPDSSIDVAYITNLALTNQINNNNNRLNTIWPILGLSKGLAYYIDRNITLPGGRNVSTNLINLYGDPPLEYGVSVEETRLSYFVYQLGNSQLPMICPSPTPVVFNFQYTTVPVQWNGPLFSSCAVGTMTALGPFLLTSDVTNQPVSSYIIINGTGTRTFVNTTTIQTVTLLGSTSDDGADFIFYTEWPHFDYAGVSFHTLQAPLFQNGFANQDPPLQYINLWREGTRINEAIAAGMPDSYVDFHYEIATLNSSFSYKCPQDINELIRTWNYCHVAYSAKNTSSSWSVYTYGSMITTPISSSGTLYVVDITGYRSQSVMGRENVTLAITNAFQLNGSLWGGLGERGAVNDQLLSTSYPWLTSRGIMYELNSSCYQHTASSSPYTPNTVCDPELGVILPDSEVYTPYINLYGSPPAERNVGQTGLSYFIYQDLAYGSLSCSPDQISTILYFYYQSLPSTDDGYGDWNICASGQLEALGPYYYPTSNVSEVQEAYIVISASGQRVYTSGGYLTRINTILDVSNVNGGDSTLYSKFPHFDAGGISFELDTQAYFAIGSSDGNWVNIKSSENLIYEIGNFSSSTIPSNHVTWTWTSTKAESLQCLMPGDTLPYTQNTAFVLLSIALRVIGAILASQLLGLSLRSEKSYSSKSTPLVVCSACALGISGIWSSMMMDHAAISLSCNNCGFLHQPSWNMNVVLLSLLPAVLPLLISFSLLCNKHPIFRERRSRSITPVAPELSNLSPMGSQWRKRLSSKIQSSSASNPSLAVMDPKTGEPDVNSTRRIKSGSSEDIKTPNPKKLDGLSMVQEDYVVRPTDIRARGTTTWGRPLVDLRHLLSLSKLQLRANLKEFKDQFDGIFLLASLILTVSPILCRLSLGYAVEAPIRSDITVYQIIVSCSLVLLLQPSLLFLFYAKSAGYWGPILFALRIEIERQWHLATLSLYYDPQGPELSILTNASVSQSTMDSISGSIGGVTLLLVLVLQARKIRSNRLILQENFAKRTAQLSNVQTQMTLMQNSHDAIVGLAQSLIRTLNQIHLLRPEAASAKNQISLWELICESGASISDCGLVESAKLIAQVSADSLETSESFEPTLLQILTHPVTLEIFKDAMYRAHCTENIYFLIRLRQWKHPENARTRVSMAKALVRDFLTKGARNEINIPALLRVHIRDKVIGYRVRDLDINLFDQAEKEVYTLIETNNFKNFAASSEYLLCKRILLQDQAAIGKINLQALRIESPNVTSASILSKSSKLRNRHQSSSNVPGQVVEEEMSELPVPNRVSNVQALQEEVCEIPFPNRAPKLQGGPVKPALNRSTTHTHRIS